MGKVRNLVTRWLVPITGGVIALVAMFYIHSGFDFDLLLAALLTADHWWLVLLAATILLEQFINGWKRRQLLYGLKPISSLRLTGAMLAGYGANVLVPLGISPLVVVADCQARKLEGGDGPYDDGDR